MTLKEYIATGDDSIESLASRLGVSPHAVHKWVYGQREPSLDMAIRISDLSGGKVGITDLSKAAVAEAKAAA